MTTPTNLPFEPQDNDAELEKVLEDYRPSAPTPPPPPPPPAPPLSPSAESSMPPRPTPPPAPPKPAQPADDMFAGLDQTPSKSAPAIAAMSPTSMPSSQSTSGSSTLMYVLAGFFGVVILGGAGFALWYFVVRTPATTPTEQVTQTTPTNTQTPDPFEPPTNTQTNTNPPVVVDPTLPIEGNTPLEPAGTDTSVDLGTPQTAPPTGSNIPLPGDTGTPTQPTPNTPPAQTAVDSDNDGRTDEQELQVGTDPNNPDTDGDGLTDGDETFKYGTNPLDRDTDRDSYPDGQEVKNGYNPRGQGQCSRPDCTI